MNRYLNGGRHEQPSPHHTCTFAALLWVDINLYDLTSRSVPTGEVVLLLHLKTLFPLGSETWLELGGGVVR